MGRIILLLLFVLAAYLVWKAFGPSTWKKHEVEQPRAIKGPDDDEEFLWNLEKERFKQRRAQEEEEEKGLRVKMCVWLGVSLGLDLAFLDAD